MTEKKTAQGRPIEQISQEIALLREEVSQVKALLLASLKYLTQEQACLFLGVSRATLIKFVQPELKPIRVGYSLAYKKQKYLFAMADIEAFLLERHRNSDHWERGSKKMKEVKEETDWEKSLSQEELEVWDAYKKTCHDGDKEDYPFVTLKWQKKKLKELMNTGEREKAGTPSGKEQDHKRGDYPNRP